MIPTKSAHQINYSKFMYFHTSTKGNPGRAVYIDPQLLVRFMELIDTNVAKGQEVARGIIGLQSNAATAASDSNLSNAFQHRYTVQNVVVTYTVLQNGGRGAGVYITDLQHGYSSDKGRPGLYKVEPAANENRWLAVPDDSRTMPSLIGVLAPTDEGIADPNKTARAFADRALVKESRKISNGFALFYTPTYAIDNTGTWITSAQKQTSGSVSLPKSFAQILANTENKATTSGDIEKHKWYIVGQGAKIFQQALQEYKQLSRHQLRRSHEFYFIDPQIPLGLLQKDLRDNAIDFARDKNIIESSMSVTSQVHQLIDPTQMYCDMYKPCNQYLRVSANVKEVNKVLSANMGVSACFSDLVKKLSVTLAGKW